MDRYLEVSAPILSGSIIRVRLFYNQKGFSTNILELNFKVLEIPQNPSLGLLSQFVQEEIIKRLNRIILEKLAGIK